MIKELLKAQGVSCDRIGEVFTLQIPRQLQVRLLGGDLTKVTERLNRDIHRRIFTAFNLNFDKEWEMSYTRETTTFQQLWDNSLEADDEENNGAEATAATH
jgi:hypothetical protein